MSRSLLTSQLPFGVPLLRPPKTRTDFLAQVSQNGIVEERLESLLLEIAFRAPNLGALVQSAIRTRLLTPLQVEWMLRGESASLVIGRYVIESELGGGGMGKVYKARHRLMDLSRAIKIIRPDCELSPPVVERFRREIKTAAKLRHANIVEAIDAGEVGRRLYLVMEYVVGMDLGKVVKARGPLVPAEAADYIRQAAIGLQYAHDMGLVHRDLKPTNLLVTEGGRVRIVDFGIALLREALAGESILTPAATAMGTPDFMAPEQATDAHCVDIRADIYSLGCTLYTLLAGQVPFPGGSVWSKIARHQSKTPQPLPILNARVQPELAAVVGHMMERDPVRRPETPAAVASLLEPFGQQ